MKIKYKDDKTWVKIQWESVVIGYYDKYAVTTVNLMIKYHNGIEK